MDRAGAHTRIKMRYGPVHVWRSPLQPEQLPARIRDAARSFGPDWHLEWKVLPNGYRLWLRSDLPVFQVKGQLPLCLWVRAAPEGCRVTGVFLPAPWEAVFALLVPPLLLSIASHGRIGLTFPWWVSWSMTAFLLLGPRLFTVWSRDRRLLTWVETSLLEADRTKGERA